MDIGIKVRKYRETKGYSQQGLADLLEVAQTTVSNIESGKSVPNALLLAKLAETFEIGIEELLDASKTPIANIKEGENGLLSNYSTVYLLSEKLIELYEACLQEKDELIRLLKQREDNVPSSIL